MPRQPPQSAPLTPPLASSTESNAFCTRCVKHKPLTEFATHHNGALYKTCRRCLVRRALSSFPSSLTGSRRRITNDFENGVIDPEADRLDLPYIVYKLIKRLLP